MPRITISSLQARIQELEIELDDTRAQLEQWETLPASIDMSTYELVCSERDAAIARCEAYERCLTTIEIMAGKPAE